MQVSHKIYAEQAQIIFLFITNIHMYVRYAHMRHQLPVNGVRSVACSGCEGSSYRYCECHLSSA